MMRAMSRAAVLPLIALSSASPPPYSRSRRLPFRRSYRGDRSAWRWYKGNTHTHTLQSDGDSTPDEVTRWYKERGYHFLVLSDHNVLTPIAELARAHAVPEQFLLVPGEEVTDEFAKKPLHINGLNVDRLVEPQHGGSVTETAAAQPRRHPRGARRAAHQPSQLRLGDRPVGAGRAGALPPARDLQRSSDGEQPRRRRSARPRGGVGPAARRRPARLRHRRRRRPRTSSGRGTRRPRDPAAAGWSSTPRGSRRRRS